MGNYYSILNDRLPPPVTMPYYWRANSDHSDYQKTKSPVMSPKIQRLDSVGEDVRGARFTPSTLVYGSGGCNMNKIMTKPEVSKKASCGNLFPFHMPTSNLSKSISMSVTSNACELRLGRRNHTGYCEQLLKSHSLPEVGTDFSNCGVQLKPANMHSNVIHKPNRSLSVGCYCNEKIMYQKQPLNITNMSFDSQTRLFDTPVSKSSEQAACDTQVSSNCQDFKSSNDSLKSPNSFSALNSSTTTGSTYFEFSSSPKSSLEQCEKTSKKNEVDISQVGLSMKQTKQMSPVQASSPRETSLGSCRHEHNKVDSNHDHDLSSILFSPRKTKKGRPSSKKQKKRKREKQKHTSKAKLDTCSDSVNESVDNQTAQCGGNAENCEHDYELSSSVINVNNDSNSSLSLDVSTPKQSPAKHSKLHWFLSSTASSDSEDSESDGEEHSDSSLFDEHETACISPIKGQSFGISHNLDSIFKQQHVPSLESLLSSNCSADSISASPSRGNSFDLSESGSVIFSDGEDGDISIEFAASSPVPSFTKERVSPVPSMQPISSGPLEDDDFVLDCIETDFAVDLGGINLKWDEMYSSPDVCNCCNKNYAAGASGPFMKVQFLEEPALSTVYTVADIGNEDRAGMWHHFALDRERFQRRINEASQILSPVLKEAHRFAIIKRNADLQKHNCGNNDQALKLEA